MKEDVQDSVQELVTENQINPDSISNRESELLREVMQKKERLQKAENEISEMKLQADLARQKQLEEQEEYKKLYEESQKKVEMQTPLIEKFEADQIAETQKLLSDFSDEDQEEFKGLPLTQLRVVHRKLLKTKINVPSVDTSSTAGLQGYSSLIEVANDYASGKIKKSTYEQIKENFRSRIGR